MNHRRKGPLILVELDIDGKLIVSKSFFKIPQIVRVLYHFPPSKKKFGVPFLWCTTVWRRTRTAYAVNAWVEVIISSINWLRKNVLDNGAYFRAGCMCRIPFGHNSSVCMQMTVITGMLPIVLVSSYTQCQPERLALRLKFISMLS